MFWLCKMLLWCLSPQTLVMMGFLAVIIWLIFRRQWKPTICLSLLLLVWVVFSLPWVAMKMGCHLEGAYPPIALERVPAADAIIVLGGGIGGKTTTVPFPECYSGSDRAVMAAWLWHAKKAPVIIPSGAGSSEAEKPFFEGLGIPPERIICEDVSRDTAENALHTITLLRTRKYTRVLVVSSAWHLRRAMMLFQYPDIEFIPVGCDYESIIAADNWNKMPLWQQLPSTESMVRSIVFLKEYLGILFYSIRKAPTVRATEATAQPLPSVQTPVVSSASTPSGVH